MAASLSAAEPRHYGALVARVNPEVLAPELERIRAAHGGLLMPDDVVEAARDPASPLHEVFEWDDAKAAANWRRTQARALIRFVMPADSDRRYVSLVVGDQRGYVPAREASAVQTLREQMLKQALAEVQAMRRRYEALSEIASVLERTEQELVEVGSA